MPASHYDVLGVPQDATADEIRQSYRRLILLHHPDRQRAQQHRQSLHAEALNAAYEVLLDPARRKSYDSALREKQDDKSTTNAVSHVISLSDFIEDEQMAGEKYRFPSRCGGEFEVTADQLEDGNGDLLLQCDGCTERIRVVYEIAEAD